MEIEFDSEKRNRTLLERGLDFARAAEVFAGRHFTAEDARQDYSEPRFITVGKLDGRKQTAKSSSQHWCHSVFMSTPISADTSPLQFLS